VKLAVIDALRVVRRQLRTKDEEIASLHADTAAKAAQIAALQGDNAALAAALALKAATTYVDGELALRDTALAARALTTYVNAELATRDTAIGARALAADVTAGLAARPAFTLIAKSTRSRPPSMRWPRRASSTPGPGGRRGACSTSSPRQPS
jgi:hypothetical protein